jgi:phage repressor protein C with HTH and peptisase S24 domain
MAVSDMISAMLTPANTTPRNRIEELRRARRMSMDALGEAIGTSASTINKLEKGGLRLSDRWAGPIAEALNVTPGELFNVMPAPPAAAPASQTPRALPVFGMAAGAITGAHMMTSDPIEFVPAPSALTTVRDAYALIVVGSSMEPRYTAGDYIWLHPHKPVRPGDHVALQEERDGGVNVWVKRFEKLTDSHLVTWQYNPASEVKFLRSRITAVHRILTTNELLGV